MTTDLIAFIEARLTEDELWAKAASTQPSYYVDERPVPEAGLHWTWAVGESWEPYPVDPLEEFVGETAHDYAPTLVTVEQWPSRYGGRMSQTKVLGNCEEVPSGVGGHIVRHDPARVLREVEAKRRLLGRIFGFEQSIDAEWGCGHTSEAIAAGECPEPSVHFIAALRDFAAVWSDHPDWREAWRP